MNETSLPKGSTSFNYPREYDLVVRVDGITTIEPYTKAAKVMTGGCQAEIKVSIENNEKGIGQRKEEIEATKCIKISDTMQM